MIRPARLLVSMLAMLAMGFTALTAISPAHAQTEDDRRLDRIEKQVRELRAIVFQGRDTGQPVTVKPEGPDPEVVALQQRVSDLDETIRKLNGQIEVLTHDSDEARAAANAVRDQNGELRGQLKDLSDRVAKLETALAPPATGAAPGQAPSPGPTGQLTLPPNYNSAGSPPAADAAPPTPGEQYKHARALLAADEFVAATTAFQAFIAQNPNYPDIAGAYYWLGEADSARQAYADAVPAYANALKGWPKSAWASEATVSLARALAMAGQPDKACAALGEFDRRYRLHASSLVKKRALDVRTRANCAG